LNHKAWTLVTEFLNCYKLIARKTACIHTWEWVNKICTQKICINSVSSFPHFCCSWHRSECLENTVKTALSSVMHKYTLRFIWAISYSFIVYKSSFHLFSIIKSIANICYRIKTFCKSFVSCSPVSCWII
jgi:hypothetical protein